jgi:hypothetical protein
MMSWQALDDVDRGTLADLKSLYQKRPSKTRLRTVGRRGAPDTALILIVTYSRTSPLPLYGVGLRLAFSLSPEKPLRITRLQDCRIRSQTAGRAVDPYDLADILGGPAFI